MKTLRIMTRDKRTSQIIATLAGKKKTKVQASEVTNESIKLTGQPDDLGLFFRNLFDKTGIEVLHALTYDTPVVTEC